MSGYRVVAGVLVALTPPAAPGRVKPRGWAWLPDGRCLAPSGVVRSAKAARRIALGGKVEIQWRRDE